MIVEGQKIPESAVLALREWILARKEPFVASVVVIQAGAIYRCKGNYRWTDRELQSLRRKGKIAFSNGLWRVLGGEK